MNFYDLEYKTPSGKTVKMDEYKGKTVLVVNTATKCGLAPQFEGLEALYQKYKGQGLVILGFPSNQFMGQEPETNESMVKTCKINFGVTFPLTEKIQVNGKSTHPVFRFLKEQLGGFLGRGIKWNFTKFLITPQGQPYKRYKPTVKPAQLEADILSLMEQS